MDRLLLACTALAFVGAIGSAKADAITLTSMTIWSQDTSGSDATSTAAIQQANPAAIPHFTVAPTPLASGPASTSDGAITLNLGSPPPPPVGGTSTIGAFLATDPDLTFAACGSACQGTTLSVLGFTHVTLFEFTFTVPGSENSTNTFSGTSDDGESLFLDGTTTNLFGTGSDSPRFEGTNTAMNLIPGGTYHLFYTSANGDPETLETSLTSPPPHGTPEPTSLALLGSGLVGLGLFYRRRRSITAG